MPGLGAGGPPLGWGSRVIVSRVGRGPDPALLGMLWGAQGGFFGEPWRGPLPTHSVVGQQEGGDPGQGRGHQAGTRVFQRLFHVRASPDPGVQRSECPTPNSTLPPYALSPVEVSGPGHSPCSSHHLPSSLRWGLLPPETVATPLHRPSAALTRTVMASSVSRIFGRPTPSSVSTPTQPLPTQGPCPERWTGLFPHPTLTPPSLLACLPSAAAPHPQRPLTLYPTLGRRGG